MSLEGACYNRTILFTFFEPISFELISYELILYEPIPYELILYEQLAQHHSVTKSPSDRPRHGGSNRSWY
jgi:hypothetical protein